MSTDTPQTPLDPYLMAATPGHPLPPRGTLCSPLVNNLASNALPYTALLMAMVEYAHPVGLAGMRPRDSWLGEAPMAEGAPMAPTVSFLLHVGGEDRGTYGAFWARLRAHPLYLSDADIPTDKRYPFRNHGVATFLAPKCCAKPLRFLLQHVPYVRDTSTMKAAEAMAGCGDTAPRRPPSAPTEFIARVVGDLVVRVEHLRVHGVA